MDKLSIQDVDLVGKRVLIRVDFNVPMDKKTKQVLDTRRIENSLPTIQYALDQGAHSIVLLAHFARPGMYLVYA